MDRLLQTELFGGITIGAVVQSEIFAIVALLVVVAIVVWRLPKVEVDHSRSFRFRRAVNWLPLGLTYAFLYMGRYNLTESKRAFEQMRDSAGDVLMGNEDFAAIFAVGTVVYGFSFLLNGPLTDRFGGRFSILVSGAGTLVMNALMGLCAWTLLVNGPASGVLAAHFVLVFSVLYGLNMYFQSFGAVAIVKVNAAWFHVRERGVFGAIFGILISLGIYFAFDWSRAILAFFKPAQPTSPNFGLVWVFLVPAAILAVFWILDVIFVRNTPGEAGHQDFDTADASSGDTGPRLGAVQVFLLMAKNPIVVTIACIEFCSGFLRQAIMQWFRTFAKQTDGALSLTQGFVYQHWGIVLCCAGILGGVFAGIISDHLFQSRRGPVAGFLYGLLLVGSVVLVFAYPTPVVGWLVAVMSMAVIGVHGMLSGTASMDFGGRKNVGIAVGIIDGFVYLGTAAMSLTYMFILPREQVDEATGKLTGPATEPKSWLGWPVAMIPLALVGLLLALRVWNAKPKPKESKP